MAAGLRRLLTAGEPILDADNGEELMHLQPAVAIVLGNRPPESPGTLHISTKQLIWLSDTDKTKGYAVDFLSVSLHAVSRDPDAYSAPCIYTQIDTGDEDDESEDSDSESDDTLDLSKISEMRLVPSDPNQLDALFEVFNECAELNPEPVEGEEEEEEHNWVFSADQSGLDEIDSDWDSSQTSFSTIGHPNGNSDLAHDVLELHINDQRFEDAEEMESKNINGGH